MSGVTVARQQAEEESSVCRYLLCCYRRVAVKVCFFAPERAKSHPSLD
jgi:hypothetical protein